MMRKDKKLLLRDLCARLPYRVKVKVRYYYECEDGTFKKYNEIKYFDAEILDLLMRGDRSLDDIKPYLRSMSSMTVDEKIKYLDLLKKYQFSDSHDDYVIYDWLNKKMFDYRGLISKGDAIEITKKK